MRTRILRTLSRINEAHPWSHNNAYAPFVLYQAWRARRTGAVTGLDVGCGTGDLLRRLARVLPQASGLEPDPATAEKASAATRGLENATVVSGSFPTTEPSRYDFVSMLAVLHHLPLEDGIRAAKESLKPGGRLVIVGCFEGPAAQWSEVLSLGFNPLVGLLLHPRRATRIPECMTAPTAKATDSFERIRDALVSSLPGVRIRRGLFWRYTAVWVAPKE